VPSLHPRIALTRDPELDAALRRAERVLGPKPAATLVRELALRGSADLPHAEDEAARRRLDASGAVPARRTLRDALPELQRRLASQPVDHESRLSEAVAEMRADRI
jgi:hypothetical protein